MTQPWDTSWVFVGPWTLPPPHMEGSASTYGKMSVDDCFAKCVSDPQCNAVLYDLPPRTDDQGNPPDPSVLGTCNTSPLATTITSTRIPTDTAFDHFSSVSWVRAPAAGAPLYATVDGIEASIQDCATVLDDREVCTAVSGHDELCSFGGACYGRCQMLSNAYNTCSAQCDENDECLGFTVDVENQFCALIHKTPQLEAKGLDPIVLTNIHGCVARRYFTYVKTSPYKGWNTALIRGERVRVSPLPKSNVNRLALLIASIVTLTAFLVLFVALFGHRRRLDVGMKNELRL